jgi:hypothetical protein
MYAGLQGRPIARQTRNRRDDFAGLAFGRAPDRTAGIAINGFGINGAAGAGGSRGSIFAVFSSQSRRAGLAWFACRAGIALVPLRTLEASPKRNRGGFDCSRVALC